MDQERQIQLFIRVFQAKIKGINGALRKGGSEPPACNSGNKEVAGTAGESEEDPAAPSPFDRPGVTDHEPI